MKQVDMRKVGYDAQGNVVDVTDRSGTVVASYAYDAFGALVSSSESFPNGWSNPFRYDGAQGVRYDAETGLYWMSVRAYDPTLGRFLSRDPLGRLAAMGLDTQPYVYSGNNPVNRTDPSGMLIWGGPGTGQTAVRSNAPRSKTRITVDCGENQNFGDQYFNDPHCVAWRAWMSNQSLQTQAVNDLYNRAGDAYIDNANIALAFDSINFTLGIVEGGVSGYLGAAAAAVGILANLST